MIEGIEPLRWGVGRENTFIAAFTAAVRAMGDGVDYEYVMGVSGAAFRLHFHQPNWCPSSPDATCGFDHSRPALWALGRAGHMLHATEPTPQAMGQLRASLAGGRPVVAIHLARSSDWGVIAGFDPRGQGLLCQTLWNPDETYAEAERWPWAMLIFEESGEPVERDTALHHSLKLAAELWETEHFDKYASGREAYRCWAADLRDPGRYEYLDEPGLAELMHTNGWCYSSLIDARRAAAAYLDSIAGELGLADAARAYAELHQLLERGRGLAPLAPAQIQDHEGWSRDMREAQASILDQAAALEGEAVGLLNLA